MRTRRASLKSEDASWKHLGSFVSSERHMRLSAYFLRLAAGFIMMRDAVTDVVLRNVGPDGGQVLPLKKGTRIVVDVVGLRTPLLLAFMNTE